MTIFEGPNLNLKSGDFNCELEECCRKDKWKVGSSFLLYRAEIENGDLSVTKQPPRKDNSTTNETSLIERLVGRENMMKAYTKVVANKGAAGIDNMTVAELMPYLRDNWARIKEEILKEKYKPSPVARVVIPKPNGGVRQLGIPTVLDRLIQQAIHQVISPIFDPHFS